MISTGWSKNLETWKNLEFENLGKKNLEFEKFRKKKQEILTYSVVNLRLDTKIYKNKWFFCHHRKFVS